jgi:hypothetical protein
MLKLAKNSSELRQINQKDLLYTLGERVSVKLVVVVPAGLTKMPL